MPSSCHANADGGPPDVVATVLNVVLPDNDADNNDHPWELLAGLAKSRDYSIDPSDLMRMPYEVHLSSAVLKWLKGGE